MKRHETGWRHIESALTARGQATKPRPAADFWADFQARMALYPQQQAPVRAEHARIPWLLALGGAGAMLLVVAAISLVSRPAQGGARTGVLSYEVPADHDAVMIWRDEATDATILWVTDSGAEAKEPI